MEQHYHLYDGHQHNNVCDDHRHDDHVYHDHTHGEHAHEHRAGHSWMSRMWGSIFHGHSHANVAVDTALETSKRGLWALKVSLIVLFVTALFQLGIALTSGSAGLLADTIHNFADALTAIPLGIAFVLGRRAATRRYTYGYGRAEDLAGVLIVVIILASSLIAGYESVLKFLHPEPLRNVLWVMGAAIVGFVGNEAVAVFRIRVGREIGSAALIADGQHARVDGLTSLAVLFGALVSLLGFPLADPIMGMLITLVILFIVKDTCVAMWQRLMDMVDPSLVENMERVAAMVPGVEQVHDMRVRWSGHLLQTEAHVVVDEDLSTRESHRIAEEVRHALLHAQSRLGLVTIHVDPCGHGGTDAHEITAHHESLF
jgi:cation diffusion facilitator family transporter